MKVFNQPKRLHWVKYNKFCPPKTSDGKKYICLSFFGDMQVCVWDGICKEWIYTSKQIVQEDLRSEVEWDAVRAAVSLINKRLPAKYQINEKDIKDIHYEMIEEEYYTGDVYYFDNVEWYMEIPSEPVETAIEAKAGESVQADIYEQELDLMCYIEQAIREYSGKNAKILTDGDEKNAP